ncbi:signal peptidase I [Agromyces soli]
MSTTKTLKRTGDAAIAAAAVIATALAALMLLPGMLGFDRYVITGGSMSGTFERGSLVFEQRVPIDELRVGDVITYLPPAESGLTELVTHRIVSIEPVVPGSDRLVFQTKGDANENADPWTFELADTVQPRVVGWLPVAGWAFIALAQPMVRMLVIGVPAAAIALFCLRDLLRALRPAGRRLADEASAASPNPA